MTPPPGRDNSPSSWDDYWDDSPHTLSARAFSRVASVYRERLIGPFFRRVMRREFTDGGTLLHAGCGGGQIDRFLPDGLRVVALDHSQAALDSYRRYHPSAATVAADLRLTGFRDGSFDGVYSLGVLEHFDAFGIQCALDESARVLAVGGKLVLFWPPIYGLSVVFMHGVHGMLGLVGSKSRLHPDEPMKFRSQAWLADIVDPTGLRIERCSFSYRDGFTYVVVVAVKPRIDGDA